MTYPLIEKIGCIVVRCEEGVFVPISDLERQLERLQIYKHFWKSFGRKTYPEQGPYATDVEKALQKVLGS